MASPLFFESLRHNLSIELFLKLHLLQATVYFFQSFHARHHGDIHDAVLGPPFIQGRRANASPTAKIWNRYANFDPFE